MPVLHSPPPHQGQARASTGAETPRPHIPARLDVLGAGLCASLRQDNVPVRVRSPGRERGFIEMTWRPLDTVRMNHAVEHATVALLLERGYRPPLGGYSLPSGFLIWGVASEADVAAAAEQALELLRTGHSNMAISPYCGTNAVTGLLIGAVAAALVARRRRGFWTHVQAGIAAFLAAGLLGKPVGNQIQRRLTTLQDVAGLQIAGTRTVASRPVSLVWVSTRRS